MRTTLCATTLVALVSISPVQDCVSAPANAPSTSGQNTYPFGALTSFKYQCLVPGTMLPSRKGFVHELSFAALRAGARYYDSLVIRAENTAATSLDTTFAKNLSTSATTVLDARAYVWRVGAGGFSRVGLQQPFWRDPSLGANLVIEIELRGPRVVEGGSPLLFQTGVGVTRLFASGYTGSAPAKGFLDPVGQHGALRVELCFDLADSSVSGLGCRGSNGLTPSIVVGGKPAVGRTFVVSVFNAPKPSAPTVLVMGQSNAHPLPVDLGTIGAPGCTLYVAPEHAVPVPTLQGNATLFARIPSLAGLAGTRLYGQFLVFDARANRLGLSTSAYARVLVGR